MIIWINGAFGAGKTTVAHVLHRRLPGSFVYDPENAGIFIRSNYPPELVRPDFQDFPAWRETNYLMLKAMNAEYKGIIIAPMTLVNPLYFEGIIGRLRADGVLVHHFALLASRNTLLRRLNERGDGEQSWAAGQIDRCVESLSDARFHRHIDSDDLPVERILEIVSYESGVRLEPTREGGRR